jgi:AcrR family transcriptional regulator
VPSRGNLSALEVPAADAAAIADRAGVGKQTIYRWWPSKSAVLLDAMIHRAQQVAPSPDTGDLAADLRLFLRSTFAAAPGNRSLLIGVLREALGDAETMDRLAAFTAARRDEMMRDRARNRGQIGAAGEAGNVVDQAFGLLWYRMIFEHERSTSRPPMTSPPRSQNSSAMIRRVEVGFAVERFDHIVLNCNDVEATAAWYERVLGMTRETFGPSNRTALSFGNQKINLRPIGALDDDPEWVTGTVEAAGSEDLCFITRATPDEVRAHLAGCGVEITAGPVTKTGAMGAMTSHYCRDLDGNLVEVAVY